MPWFLVSPGHQQPWCWSCKINRPLSSMKKKLNCIRPLNAEKCWKKTNIFSYVSSKQLRMSIIEYVIWRFQLLMKQHNFAFSLPTVNSTHRDSMTEWLAIKPLQWRHNGRGGVSNHQPHDCLLNRLIRCRSKKTSKLRVTGLCAGNSPVTGEFPAQMARNAENVSIWWRHKKSLELFTHLKRVNQLIRPSLTFTSKPPVNEVTSCPYIPWTPTYIKPGIGKAILTSRFWDNKTASGIYAFSRLSVKSYARAFVW